MINTGGTVYYAELQMGSEHDVLEAIVDTGSSWLIVAGDQCHQDETNANTLLPYEELTLEQKKCLNGQAAF